MVKGRTAVARWSLKPDDVVASKVSSSSGGRAKLRESRALDTRTVRLQLEHRPTGLTVDGSVGPGNYGRTELRALEADLKVKLLAELSQKVSAHLRLRGR